MIKNKSKVIDMRGKNMRYSRQNKILDLITKYEIDTQERLANMLEEEGEVEIGRASCRERV